MYKTETKRVALRLLQTDENLAREYFLAPTARVLNRALEIYVSYLQHCTDEQLATKVALHFPDKRLGSRRLYNFRMRLDLHDYIMMHRFVLSATIGAAMDFYVGYTNLHPGELGLLRGTISIYRNTYIDTGYILLKARRG